MSKNIYNLEDERLIAHALDFVVEQFEEAENKNYSKKELLGAVKNLRNFDVFDSESLCKLVKLSRVRVFGVLDHGRLSAVSALEVETGRIMFIASRPGKDHMTDLRDLLEEMVEARIDKPDSRLQILSFLGQVSDLRELGFFKLYDSVIINSGIKFVPMQYNYTQIDTEM